MKVLQMKARDITSGEVYDWKDCSVFYFNSYGRLIGVERYMKKIWSEFEFFICDREK